MLLLSYIHLVECLVVVNTANQINKLQAYFQDHFQRALKPICLNISNRWKFKLPEHFYLNKMEHIKLPTASSSHPISSILGSFVQSWPNQCLNSIVLIFVFIGNVKWSQCHLFRFVTFKVLFVLLFWVGFLFCKAYHKQQPLLAAHSEAEKANIFPW